VDTFDSNSFVQSGKNLRYILPYSREYSAIRATRTLLELDGKELTQCQCRACKEYASRLDWLKDLSGRTAQISHEGAERKYIKSEVYTFLALHALEIELREFEIIRQNIYNDKLRRYVLEYAQKTNNQSALVRAFEAATGEIVGRPKARKVSLSLSRESFAVPETYKPPKEKEILLLIPCTKDKPYKRARAHEAIKSALHKDERVHIVTISGLYGPVPEELEEEPEILEYDYMLSPQAKEQVDFLRKRLVAYLKAYGNHYRQVFAYVTVKAYREVAKQSLKEYGRGQLLPKKLKERTSKEFLKRENIRELQETIGTHLGGSTFLIKQLELQFS
jgi:predicted RNA-binding protein